MSKQALLLLVDVGHSMDQQFSDQSSRAKIALQCCKATLQQKMFNNASHQIGLMIFGDNDSDDGNTLTLQALQKPMIDFVRQVQALSNAKFENKSAGGDIFNALYNAVEYINEHCKKKKYNKRIFMFTNGSGKSGMQMSNLRQLANMIQEVGIKVNIIPIDFMVSYDSSNNTLEGQILNPIQQTNAQMLLRLKSLQPDHIQIFPASLAIQLYKRFRKKDTNPVALFRGQLQFAPGLSVQVATYKAIRRQKLKSLSRYDMSVQFDPIIKEKQEVIVETNYIIQGDQSGSIMEKENIVNAFMYGPQLVPISPILEAGTKMFEDKNLKFLGFVDRAKIHRQCLMGQVDIVIPSQNISGRKLFSAFIHSMLSLRKYAIARYVSRNNKNGVVPRMVVLIPYRSSQREMFYLVEMPTAEDVKDYPFNPLKASNESQKNVVRDLISKMMLYNKVGDQQIEQVKVENTFNPFRQYFYQAIFYRAMNQDNKDIPPLDPVIKNYISPQIPKFKAAQPTLRQIKKQFKLVKKLNLQQAKQKQKQKTIIWKQVVEQALKQENKNKNPQQMVDQQLQHIPVGKDSYKFSLQDQDEQVRFNPANPITSFRKMINFNKKDLVEQALKTMNDFIHDKLLFAITPDTIKFLGECSGELRQACVSQQEARYWDRWFRDMKGRKESFYDYLRTQGIGMIEEDNREIFRAVELHAEEREDEIFSLD